MNKYHKPAVALLVLLALISGTAYSTLTLSAWDDTLQGDYFHLVGDANNDGVIDINDILLLLDHIFRCDRILSHRKAVCRRKRRWKN